MTRTEARRDAQQMRDLPRLEHRVDRKHRTCSLASPDREVGFGKIGQDERDRTIGRNAQRGENVCGACHVGDEFGVGPDMRLVEAVGRHGRRKEPWRLGSAYALSTSAA